LQCGHLLKFEGKSYRLKEAAKRLAKKKEEKERGKRKKRLLIFRD